MSWKLWERFGVEQEFMIVDRDTLDVLPRADLLLKNAAGEIESEIVRADVGWSNELVSHVIELKAAQPLTSLQGWSDRIASEIRTIDAILAPAGARLLPTAAHPWMDPLRETVLWPHENTEIYRAYDRIFNCQGHGWANLQSVHLNLSFAGDVEFGRLHAAIRAVLPLIPGLTAASPFLDGRFCGFLDGRLETYRHNQERIPVIAGEVIPEEVFTEKDYDTHIFSPVREAIRPFDPEGLLSQFFLNSRGAIARFDRGAIEIRIIDLQECPAADLAILQTVVALLRLLVDEAKVSMPELMSLDTRTLAACYHRVVRYGEDARIDDAKYLRVFGLPPQSLGVGEIWKRLWPQLSPGVESGLRPIMETMMDSGTLSSRLLRVLGHTPSHSKLLGVYRELADCLLENQLWAGR